jgi:hypothetical protein
MKKSKMLVVLLIGTLLTVGFIFTGCEDKENCPNAGECHTGGVNDTYSKSSCGKSSCATTGKDERTMSSCDCN